MVTNNNKYTIDYFAAGPGNKAVREASFELTRTDYNKFKDVFSGCF